MSPSPQPSPPRARGCAKMQHPTYFINQCKSKQKAKNRQSVPIANRRGKYPKSLFAYFFSRKSRLFNQRLDFFKIRVFSGFQPFKQYYFNARNFCAVLLHNVYSLFEFIFITTCTGIFYHINIKSF